MKWWVYGIVYVALGEGLKHLFKPVQDFQDSGYSNVEGQNRLPPQNHVESPELTS